MIILHGAAGLEDPHPIWSNLTTHDKDKLLRAERFLGLKISGAQLYRPVEKCGGWRSKSAAPVA